MKEDERNSTAEYLLPIICATVKEITVFNDGRVALECWDGSTVWLEGLCLCGIECESSTDSVDETEADIQT